MSTWTRSSCTGTTTCWRRCGGARWLRWTSAARARAAGDRAAVAADLHIHPQTVRYRLKQLRELFGPDLDGDPDTRLRLTLALAWGPPHDGGADAAR